MIDSHEEALIYALANNPKDLREEILELWIGNLLFISKPNLNHKGFDPQNLFKDYRAVMILSGKITSRQPILPVLAKDLK